MWKFQKLLTLDEDLQAINTHGERENQSSPGTSLLIDYPIQSDQSQAQIYI